MAVNAGIPRAGKNGRTAAEANCEARWLPIESGGMGRKHLPQAQRIVSLAPSATSILCAIGAKSQLVGVTKWCADVAPVAKLPKLRGILVKESEFPGGVSGHGALGSDCGPGQSWLQSKSLAKSSIDSRAESSNRRALILRSW